MVTREVSRPATSPPTPPTQPNRPPPRATRADWSHRARPPAGHQEEHGPEDREQNRDDAAQRPGQPVLGSVLKRTQQDTDVECRDQKQPRHQQRTGTRKPLLRNSGHIPRWIVHHRVRRGQSSAALSYPCACSAAGNARAKNSRVGASTCDNSRSVSSSRRPPPSNNCHAE